MNLSLLFPLVIAFHAVAGERSMRKELKDTSRQTLRGNAGVTATAHAKDFTVNDLPDKAENSTDLPFSLATIEDEKVEEG